jgi:hypothetical protein
VFNNQLLKINLSSKHIFFCYPKLVLSGLAYIQKYLPYLYPIMELIIFILCCVGFWVLLKYFGKGIILAIAAILTPLFACYQLASGKASNHKHAIIIAICGMIVILSGILFACIF